MQDQNSQPLNNLVFDMVTILHSKGEGLNAYDKYLKDAQAENSQPCIDLLQRLKQQDESTVMEVQSHLSKLIENGSMGGMQSQQQADSQRTGQQGYRAPR